MKAFKIILLLCCALACFACNNKDENENSLQGTKWKLVGFFDGATNTLKAPEPDTCANCFRISFQASQFSGMACINTYSASYEVDGSTIKVTDLIQTTIGILYVNSEDLYLKSIKTVYSFHISDNTLKLYYNNQDYLLFTME